MITIINLKLLNDKGEVRFKAYGEDIDERFVGEYMPGDKFRVELLDGEFVRLVLDETLAPSIVYVPDGVFEFEIPFGDVRHAGYAPEAFSGESHRIRVSEPTEAEIYGERMISLNSHDRHNVPKYFPHAVANFVTRESPSFFERNAIDGVCDNSSHGHYPYHSWGGGLREDLDFAVQFGCACSVNAVTIFIRADFPHDTYWKEAVLEFSDGSKIPIELQGIPEGQTFTFEPKITEARCSYQ
ncbi:MAG: hypothetical protein IIX96_03875, partial [Clostridia bacterium]|nr:hypothetical protein [Clostridia bacterium]